MCNTPARVLGAPVGTAAEVARLVLRVTLGVVMFLHGLQKLTDMGFGAMGPAFEGMGVPLPGLTGPLVLLIELIGGIAMIIGLATPVVGAIYALVMLGAGIVVHAPMGFFAGNGGYEFVLVLAVLSAYFAVIGAGKYSVDQILAPRFAGRSSVAA